MSLTFEPPVCSESPIQADLHTALQKLLDRPGVIKHPIRPSAITQCQRQIWYQYQNFKKPGAVPTLPTGTRKLMTFDRGHRAEKQVGDWLRQIDKYEVVPFKQQFKVAEIPDPNSPNGILEIYGEIDFILVERATGKKRLLDVKSVAERTFLNIYDTNRPKLSNYLQQQLYMHPLRKVGINEGTLYYENANTQAFKVLEFPYDPVAYDYAVSRGAELVRQCGLRTAPPREYLIGEWQCDPKYCDFHDYCYAPLNTNAEYSVNVDDSQLDRLLANKLSIEDEASVIKYLQNFGDAATYRYKNYLLKIKRLKTKLKLDVTNAP